MRAQTQALLSPTCNHSSERKDGGLGSLLPRDSLHPLCEHIATAAHGDIRSDTHTPASSSQGQKAKQTEVLRHQLHLEPSTEQLLNLNCPNPTGQTPGVVTHSQEKQNWRQRENWARSRAPRAGPALGLPVEAPCSSSLPGQLEQGLSRECRVAIIAARMPQGWPGPLFIVPAQLCLGAAAHR